MYYFRSNFSILLICGVVLKDQLSVANALRKYTKSEVILTCVIIFIGMVLMIYLADPVYKKKNKKNKKTKKCEGPTWDLH